MQEFEQLIKSIYPRVYSFALKLTRNPEDAADVAQETFVRAFKARDRRLVDRNPDSWLFRITYRCFLDSRRWAARRPTTVSFELMGTDSHKFDPADSALTPEQVFFSSQLSGPMSRALANLTKEQQQLMHLSHSEGLSHQEMSEIYGCGATTIKTRIHRVHASIRRQLTAAGLDTAGACIEASV